MSENDTTSYNHIFVEMLSKYKELLERNRTSEMNRKKNEAAFKLSVEFSRKTDKKLTAKQVFKKIYDIKQRLKEKNSKYASKRVQAQFSNWERMFLEMWVGNGIIIKKNKPSEKLPPVEEPPKYKTPEEIIRNFEADYNLLEDDTHTSSGNSSHSIEFEPERQPVTPSESPIDVNRAALISQIKMLKAKEALARSQENAHLYKLSLLQHNKAI